MAIDAMEILSDINSFLTSWVNDPDPDVQKDLKSSLILRSYDKELIKVIAYSAVVAYHCQLREVLLQQGIDIGELLLPPED